MIMKVANIRVESIMPWAAIIVAPSPSCPLRNSPTTAPIRAKTTETRTPAKMVGKPCGIFNFRSVCRRVAPSILNNSRFSVGIY